MSSIKSKLLKVWQDSQTKALAYTQATVAGATGVLAYADSIFSTDVFKNFLGTLTVPHWIPPTIAGISVLTYIAHGHKND